MFRPVFQFRTVLGIPRVDGCAADGDDALGCGGLVLQSGVLGVVEHGDRPVASLLAIGFHVDLRLGEVTQYGLDLVTSVVYLEAWSRHYIKGSFL